MFFPAGARPPGFGFFGMFIFGRANPCASANTLIVTHTLQSIKLTLAFVAIICLN